METSLIHLPYLPPRTQKQICKLYNALQVQGIFTLNYEQRASLLLLGYSDMWQILYWSQASQN